MAKMTNEGEDSPAEAGRAEGMRGRGSARNNERSSVWESVRDSVRDFFWFCSGASFALLKRCPTESAKYTSIGGTVFFTGVLAATSGGFAVYSIFKTYLGAILVGLLWGLMIFNLDRFLVSSMKKQNKIWKEWLMALPRLVLAILIAVVIARPLELRIFSPEIQSELAVIGEERLATQQAMVGTRYRPQILDREREIAVLEEQILQKTRTRDTLAKIAQEEADGTGGSRQRNLGPIYAVKKADALQAQQELDELSQRNLAVTGTLRSEIDSLRLAQGREVAAIDVAGMGGMALQMEALYRLAQKHDAIRMANLFIMLLFIFIETSPVLVKLLSPRGPYDDLLETHEYGFVIYKKGKVHQFDKQLEQKIAEWQ